MMQDTPLKDRSSSTGQEVLWFLWNPKGYYSVHLCLPLPCDILIKPSLEPIYLRSISVLSSDLQIVIPRFLLP